MEDRFSQQLKKGVLDMLVLHLVCVRPRYGYELLTYLKALPGTVYPEGRHPLPYFVPAGR